MCSQKILLLYMADYRSHKALIFRLEAIWLAKVIVCFSSVHYTPVD